MLTRIRARVLSGAIPSRPAVPSPVAAGSWRHFGLDGVLGLVVAAAVVYSYVTYARLPLTRPSANDYERATSHVRTRFAPGDVIDANPFWATRLREYAGDLPLEAWRDLEREDLAPYRRVWLVSLFGAERRPAVERALEGRAALSEVAQFGRINVRLYDVKGHEPVRYDFRARLDEARVWIEEAGRRRECAAEGRERRRCSPAPWNYVGAEIFEMAGEPRPVIWAHPVASGVLTIEFPDVPMGRALSIGAGFTPSGLRFPGAPVELRVDAGAQTILRRVYGAAESFSRARVDTSGLAGTRQPVRFQVRTLDDRVRHFCFAADVRG
jgi:hypothetical protein